MRGGSVAGDSASATRGRERERERDTDRQKDKETERETERENMHKMKVTGKVFDRTTVSNAIITSSKTYQVGINTRQVRTSVKNTFSCLFRLVTPKEYLITL